jgi:hypothetical protein
LAKTRHDASAGKVGVSVASTSHDSRHNHGTYVGGRFHMQVIEVKDVSGRRPATGLA